MWVAFGNKMETMQPMVHALLTVGIINEQGYGEAMEE